MVIHTIYDTEQTASMHNIEKGNIVRDILSVSYATLFLVRFQEKKKTSTQCRPLQKTKQTVNNHLKKIVIETVKNSSCGTQLIIYISHWEG